MQGVSLTSPEEHKTMNQLVKKKMNVCHKKVKP